VGVDLYLWPLPLQPPTHASIFLPVPPFPSLPIPNHFPTPNIGQGVCGSTIAPPAGPGRARLPNSYWCNSQPQICKHVLPTCTTRPCNISITFSCCKLLQCVRTIRLPSTLVAIKSAKVFYTTAPTDFRRA